MKTKTDTSIKRRGPGRPSLGDRVKTTLRLDRELHERLARLAKRRRVKVSALYVRAIEFLLKREEKVPR
jgi:predicted HicB family RNase H-like nuclease